MRDNATSGELYGRIAELEREVAELREALRAAKQYAIGGECNARENYPLLAGDFSAIAAVVSDALKSPPAQDSSDRTA